MHLFDLKEPMPGGSVKRSLAMVFCPREGAIAKAFGLDAATPSARTYVWDPRESMSIRDIA
jgi:hypothetical protein